MLDEHIVPPNWGLLPYININGIRIPTYTIFMILAFLSAFICFKLTADKKSFEDNEHRKAIIVFALLGGIIGSKLPILIANCQLLFTYPKNIALILYGKTIVGGLIGGFIAVILVKKKLNIKIRVGNDIAAPAALGMAVGRIGCLLTGCCYGIKSPAFLGIDFGDGIKRYPTQIYEFVFCMALFSVLLYLKYNKELQPGVLFKTLLNSYLIFRFFIEFIRENAKFLGITYYQVLCLVCVIFINRKAIISFIKNKIRLKIYSKE